MHGLPARIDRGQNYGNAKGILPRRQGISPDGVGCVGRHSGLSYPGMLASYCARFGRLTCGCASFASQARNKSMDNTNSACLMPSPTSQVVM